MSPNSRAGASLKPLEDLLSFSELATTWFPQESFQEPDQEGPGERELDSMTLSE